LNSFIRSGDIRRGTLKSPEIGLNFACFWPLNFFLGGKAPEILERHYKIGPSTDQRANFYAGRPTHLDLALKKNKTRSLGQSPTWVRPVP